jgi:hypothetical protein
MEVQGAAALGLIADASVKGDYGAIAGSADVVDQGGGVDWLADQLEQIFVGLRSEHGGELAATHGRKECDLVAGTERRVPGGEFPVAGGYERSAIAG